MSQPAEVRAGPVRAGGMGGRAGWAGWIGRAAWAGQGRARWARTAGPGGPETAPVRIAAPRVITAEPGPGVATPGYVAIAGGVVTEVGEDRRRAGPTSSCRTGAGTRFRGPPGQRRSRGELRTAGADGWDAVVAGCQTPARPRSCRPSITAPLGELDGDAARRRGAHGRCRPGAPGCWACTGGAVHLAAARGAHTATLDHSPRRPAAVDRAARGRPGLLRMVTLAPSARRAGRDHAAGRRRRAGQHRAQRRDGAAGRAGRRSTARGW